MRVRTIDRASARSTSSGFDAFVSYSHSADATLAPILQVELQRYAKPWYRARALNVFRDNSDLAAEPGLWVAIERALEASTWFILLASPAAACSAYVDREVAWWLKHRGSDRLLVVLTDGELNEALPPALSNAEVADSRWVDLRELRDCEAVERTDPRVQQAVVDLAAKIHGVPKSSLVGEHLRQHRRTLRWAGGAIAALSIFLIATIIATITALTERDRAIDQEQLAIARQLIAKADVATASNDPRYALRLTEAANKIYPNQETQSNLAASVLKTPFRGLIQASDPTTVAMFSPQGHILATVNELGNAELWDVSDAAHPLRLSALASDTSGTLNAPAPVDTVSFSPDGHTLAIANSNGTVQLWDVTDSTHPHRLGKAFAVLSEPVKPDIKPEAPVAVLAFSPDGRLLATADNDKIVQLWDITDLAQPRLFGNSLTGNTNVVVSVTFSPDQHILATVSIDDAALLWNIADPTHPRLIDAEPPLIGNHAVRNPVAFSPDGHYLATSGDFKSALWDVSNPNHPQQVGQLSVGQTDAVNSVVFSPDGHTLATAGEGGTVLLWNVGDPHRPQRVGDPLVGHSRAVNSLAFSADGRTLASSDGTVLLWDVTDPTDPTDPSRLRRVGDPLIGPPIDGSTVADSPNGQILAIGSGDGTVSLWNVADNVQPKRLGDSFKDRTELPFTLDSVESIAFSPDGHTLAVASFNAGVWLWDISDPTRPRELGDSLTDQTGAPLPVESVAFSPAGHILAIGSPNGSVTLYDYTDAVQLHRFDDGRLRGVPSDVTSVAFSPKGNILAVAGDDAGTVLLWDVTNPAEPRLVNRPVGGSMNPVIGMAFSPDGNMLATANSDGTVFLTDESDPADPRHVGGPLTSKAGDVIPTVSLTFSPDGHTLATARNNGTLVLWSVIDPARAHPIDVPTIARSGDVGGLTSVAISPDGGLLITDGSDGVALMWDLTHIREAQTNPLTRACTLTGGGLDPAQWALEIPALPYQDTCSS